VSLSIPLEQLVAEPSPGGQEAAVLAVLRQGRSLTQLEALAELGVGRLAAVVLRLKNAGHNVVAESIEAPCRGGRKARVARYSLGKTA